MEPKLTPAARERHEKMFPGKTGMFSITDPEFAERYDNFSFDEVVSQGKLDEDSRFLAILAALIGCDALETFSAMIKPAMNYGVTPVEIREIVYQASAYLGIGRVHPFIKAMDSVFEKNGVALPLEPQATTIIENRVEKGNDAQVQIFGDGMKGFQDSGPEETRHINRWLAGHCFGDWYTRTGLSLAQREMITFCFIAALGGCEKQLAAHTQGNFNVGNDRDFLIDVVSQLVPYIGYPRSLNALAVVNEVYESQQE